MPKRGVPELCLVIALLAACKRPETPPPARTPVVEVVRVQQRDVPIYREWIATLDGYVNAQIQPRVSGYVIAQRFKEGSFVRKNELLFEIDARPFRAALDQANAQLAERRADAARAARDVERDRPLAEARAIPRSQLDNDIQIHNAAVAAVEAARATAHQAELDVGFTRVGSLIDGIVGIAEVQVGNLVSPTSVLTTVSQVDPIRAWFAISEQEYLDVADLLHGASVPAGAGTDAGTAAHELEFELTLTDGSKYPHDGRFLFANRQVDSLTGTLRIATAFPNPRRLLRPGQFGRVRAATRIERNALLVPQRAVTELQGTFQIMVLKSDSTVTVQPVVLGPQVDSLRVIERGLQPDQLVIVEGTQQVRPGMKVAAKPYVPARGPARGTGY
jgi:membrane fusion protein (multidrug efflux system)